MNIALIIKHLKNYLKLDKDIELADFLGIKQSTLATWKHRGNIDVQLIISKCNNINPSWLLTGEGPMLKHPEPLTQNEDMDTKTEERILKFEKDIESLTQQLMKKDDMIVRLIEANVQLNARLEHYIQFITEKQESKKKQAM